MPRPRPCFPKRGRRWLDALDRWANPSSPACRRPRGAGPAGAGARGPSPKRSAGVMTSSSPPARARRSRSPPPGRGSPGAPMARPSMPSCRHAMGPESTVIPVDAGRPDRRTRRSMRFLPRGRRWSRSSRSTTKPASSSRSIALRRKIREAGSLLLADCAQSAGKMPLPDADFIAFSAHKLGGPPGVGALLVKDLATLEPVGGQEKGYRRGTQDAPSAAGVCGGARPPGRTTWIAWQHFARASRRRSGRRAA